MLIPFPIMIDIEAPAPINHASRQWLYMLNYYSPGSILTKEVKDNREYYVCMMQNYIAKLEHKIKTQDQTVKAKYNKAMVAGSISLASFGAFKGLLYHLNNYYYHGRIFEEYMENEDIASILLSIPCFITGTIAGIIGIKKTLNAARYKEKLQNKLRFNKYILSLLQQS